MEQANSGIVKRNSLLAPAGSSQSHLPERIRLCYGIMEQVCHNHIQKKVSPKQEGFAKQLAIQTMVSLLAG